MWNALFPSPRGQLIFLWKYLPLYPLWSTIDGLLLAVLVLLTYSNRCFFVVICQSEKNGESRKNSQAFHCCAIFSLQAVDVGENIVALNYIWGCGFTAWIRSLPICLWRVWCAPITANTGGSESQILNLTEEFSKEYCEKKYTVYVYLIRAWHATKLISILKKYHKERSSIYP